MADDYLHEIQQSTTENELLHGDLHHENILFSNERGWLAIDPKGVAGNPNLRRRFIHDQSSILQSLTRKQLLKLRVDLISETLQLNRELLLKAAIAMSTLYACWSVEDKDPDWNQTYQCAKWFEKILGGNENE